MGIGLLGFLVGREKNISHIKYRGENLSPAENFGPSKIKSASSERRNLISREKKTDKASEK